MNLTDYISSNTPVDATKLRECEDRMRILLIREFPDTGFSPSSVVGKFLIERFGKIVAQIETALECVLSDMDLLNVINGSVCDCDFVTEFLRGLGVDSLVNANTTGTARLSFINNGPENTGTNPYVMDKGELLQFNDNYIFNYVTPKNSSIKIYPYGYTGTVDTDSNYFFLSVSNVTNVGESDNNFQPNLYFVDIPIVGPSNAEVNAGDEAGINEHLSFFDEVESVVAAYDIAPYESPTNLAELISIFQKIQPSANFATRNNVVSFVEQKYPGITGVSPTKVGDIEMVRTDNNPFYAYSPAIDIWVKGDTTLPTCSEYFKCYVSTDENGVNTFYGTTKPSDLNPAGDVSNLPTTAQKTFIRLNHYPIASVNLNIAGEDDDAFSTSTTIDTSTLSINLNQCTARKSYTTYPATVEWTTRPNSTNRETIADYVPYQFYNFSDKDFTMAFNFAGWELEQTEDDPHQTIRQLHTYFNFPASFINADLSDYITTETDPETSVSNSYIWMRFDYQYDPVMESLDSFVKSPACDPAISTEVKACYYYYITDFTVNYSKETNKFFDRQAAIERIYDLMNSLIYPLSYSDAYISDIMVSMGASGVQSIIPTATLMLGCSKDYFDSSGNKIDGDTTIQAVTTFDPANIDFHLKIYGAGPRTISMILPRENINLVEKLV